MRAQCVSKERAAVGGGCKAKRQERRRAAADVNGCSEMIDMRSQLCSNRSGTEKHALFDEKSNPRHLL